VLNIDFLCKGNSRSIYECYLDDIWIGLQLQALSEINVTVFVSLARHKKVMRIMDLTWFPKYGNVR